MINLTQEEKAALVAIDGQELSNLIDQAVENESALALHRLTSLGRIPFLSGKLSSFDASLRRYHEAKSAKKREQTREDARRAGRELSYGFAAMNHRMEEEDRDGQFFHINDPLYWPRDFSRKLEVRVSFRWRRSIDDQWTYGNITFQHEVQSRPDYTRPAPTRKPSAAKQARDLQDELSRTWEHFMKSAHYSVRDYFREGGDGSLIPSTFRAKADDRTGILNNHSTIFWERKKPL